MSVPKETKRKTVIEKDRPPTRASGVISPARVNLNLDLDLDLGWSPHLLSSTTTRFAARVAATSTTTALSTTGSVGIGVVGSRRLRASGEAARGHIFASEGLYSQYMVNYWDCVWGLTCEDWMRAASDGVIL